MRYANRARVSSVIPAFSYAGVALVAVFVCGVTLAVGALANIGALGALSGLHILRMDHGWLRSFVQSPAAALSFFAMWTLVTLALHALFAATPCRFSRGAKRAFVLACTSACGHASLIAFCVYAALAANPAVQFEAAKPDFLPFAARGVLTQGLFVGEFLLVCAGALLAVQMAVAALAALYTWSTTKRADPLSLMGVARLTRARSLLALCANVVSAVALIFGLPFVHAHPLVPLALFGVFGTQLGLLAIVRVLPRSVRTFMMCILLPPRVALGGHSARTMLFVRATALLMAHAVFITLLILAQQQALALFGVLPQLVISAVLLRTWLNALNPSSAEFALSLAHPAAGGGVAADGCELRHAYAV